MCLETEDRRFMHTYTTHFESSSVLFPMEAICWHYLFEMLLIYAYSVNRSMDTNV